MRIQNAQHSRNRAVVNGLIRIHRLGIVLLDEIVNAGKFADIRANFTVTGAFDSGGPLSENGAHAAAKKKK